MGPTLSFKMNSDFGIIVPSDPLETNTCIVDVDEGNLFAIGPLDTRQDNDDDDESKWNDAVAITCEDDSVTRCGLMWTHDDRHRSAWVHFDDSNLSRIDMQP